MRRLYAHVFWLLLTEDFLTHGTDHYLEECHDFSKRVKEAILISYPQWITLCI